MLRQILRNPLGIVGGVLLLLVVLTAVFAPLLAPYSPEQVHFDTPFQRAFTEGFPLGTDDLGRDVLSRIVYGTRVSLLVGGLAVLLAVVVGTPLGLLAGYVGWVDVVVSRLTDLTLAFPFLIIAVGLAAINGPSVTNAAIALGIAQVPTMVRVVRAETLRHRELEFVLAARSLDASGVRILLQHILPNALSAVIVQATVIMPVAVIGEALLSFLGLGHPAADAEPRDHALRRAAVHLPGAGGRGLPRPRDRGDLPRVQPVRRRAARRPRPHDQEAVTA